MSTPTKRRGRGRPRSERPLRPFMLRLDPETLDGLVRAAARETSMSGGTRALTAQDVARRAIEAYLRDLAPSPPMDGGAGTSGGGGASLGRSAGGPASAAERSRRPRAPRRREPITRPLLQWPGGKWRLAKWVMSHFPPHDVYVEPYGGAASVLLRKPPSRREVYNDLDEGIVNLVRVLQSETLADELAWALHLTRYDRAEFEEAYGPPPPAPVERARRLAVRSFMGHGTSGTTMLKRTGFRARAPGAWTHPAADWAKYPHGLPAIAARLRGVEVESTEAIPLMLGHDGPRTLFYVDPPYLPGTRAKGAVYAHEMTADQHVELLRTLRGLKGMVILSAYPSGLYDRLLAGWERHEERARADGGRERTECLWLNPACVGALSPDGPHAALRRRR